MTDLYLIRLALDTRRLLAFARKQGLLEREVDDGYLVHAALASSFGDRLPAPFVFEAALAPGIAAAPDVDAPTQAILAYSPNSLDALRQTAGEGASALIQWSASDSKPMPLLAAGREIGFIARVTPTVRSRAPRPEHVGSGRGHGREVDAFLAACSRAPDAVVDRALVYREWLARQLSAVRHAGGDGRAPATLMDYSLRRFEVATLLRKGQPGEGGRRRHHLERPDAVISGTLRIDDAAAFRSLLARGVGRHRSFGFGMLLLRSAN